MKKSRRDILKLGAMAGAGAVMPNLLSGQTPNTRVPVQGGITFHGHVSHRTAAQKAAAAAIVNGLQQFVDPLPIMPTLRPNPNGVTHIRMQPALQKVHRDLPPTPVWGYNGVWPGPTIEVRSGVPVKIKYQNDALPK
jgi:FtsP/CotA-like multicopper oxidase with cupredoxin domain